MPTYDKTASLRSGGRFRVGPWIAAIVEHAPIDTETLAIVQTYHVLAPEVGINPDIALAQAVEETGWFSSDLWRTMHNPCGLGITGPGVRGLDYKTIRGGVMAHLAHLCCYAYDAANCPVHDSSFTPKLWGDPRHTFHDGKPAITHLQEPKPGRRWAEGPNYVENILAVLAVVEGFVNKGVTMQPVRDFPSPNYGYPQGQKGRNGRRVRALVIHISEGSLAGMRSWFSQTASGASSTYGIGKDGGRDRYVNESNSPWTNGDVKYFDHAIPWLVEAVEAGINPNELTETIEGEGFYTEQVPEAKYQAILGTVRERLLANGLTASKTTVIGHYQINGIDRANCPGPNFPWKRLYYDLGVGAAVGPKTQSVMLMSAWELGRKAAADAAAPDPYGLFMFEATADLTSILPTLPSSAQCLVCEKAVLWVGKAGAVDTFHRGQYESLLAAGKVQEWK